jgi:hypothetical protein
MAHGEHKIPSGPENLELNGRASTLSLILLVVGVVAVLAALGLSLTMEDGLRRFYHAYLTNYAYFLSIALGALFFVLIHHLARAGWSVSIRRPAEAIASTLPFMGVLALPLLVAAWSGKGTLYPWATPIPDHPVAGSAHRAEVIDEIAHDKNPPTTEGQKAHPESPQAHAGPAPTADRSPDHPGAPAAAGHAAAETGHGTDHGAVPPKGITPLTMGKKVWLNSTFWTVRVVVYFLFWSAVALYFWKSSRRQDGSGDETISKRLQTISAPLFLLSFVFMTFGAFDLVMSLDPDWYSTIFGIYYFAGCADSIVATLILVAWTLQRLGYLQNSLSREHYHDLGKWLFAFVFFWGYIAYSQYMLIWYANIPETTYWFANRGATTNPDTQITAWGWTIVCMLLLFGRLIIPFGGLLSRYVKRNTGTIVFWAVWILVFHWVDVFWLVMPEYSRSVTLGLPEILCLVGLGGIFVGSFVWRLSAAPLRPLRDPRLDESLAFQNF